MLYLDDTKLTDAGLPDLKRLGNLVNLILRGTQITDAGIGALRGELPATTVVF